MSIKLPDGSIVLLGTGYGAAKTISAITNANPGAATANAHGMANGDIGLVKSGWSKLNNKNVRIAGQTTNAFNLDGIDTTLTSLYPAGSGAGSITPISGWQQITQIIDVDTTGGDLQFTTVSFLEDDFEQQLPTVSSAQNLTLNIGDDPSLPGYQAIKVAADQRATRPLKLQFPDGGFILYEAYVGFNETPSMKKGNVMAVKATFSLRSRPVRYAS